MTLVSGESADNLRGSPSCTAVLDGHNSTCEKIVHQRHVHIHSHTQTEHRWHRYFSFLDMYCSHCGWKCLFLEGRNKQCYHDREENILKVHTFLAPHQHYLSPPLTFNIQQLSDLMRNLWMDTPAGSLIRLCRFQPLVGLWDTITVRQHILFLSIHNG